MEAVDGEQLGDVGTLVGFLERRDLRQLAVLGGELRRRSHLDALGVPERALRERREPPQRLDLIPEQVDAHSPVLGCREQVEQAAADRELPAVLDLVDALVAGRDELGGGLVEVHELADANDEPVGAQVALRDLLRQRDRGDDDDRRAVRRVGGRFQERVERGDPEADEVRRRREVRLVGDAAAGGSSGPDGDPATPAARTRARAQPDRRRRRRSPDGSGRGPATRRSDTAAATGRRTRRRRRAPARRSAGRRRRGRGGDAASRERLPLSLGTPRPRTAVNSLVYLRHLRIAVSDHPLDGVGGPVDEFGDVRLGLGEAAQHVRSDALGVGRRRPVDADADATELG